MPLAIYLKNFGMNYAKKTIEHKEAPDRVQHIDCLAQIISLLNQACLSQNVEPKYKKQLTSHITRYLNVL